ncbi:hypothetical protein Bca4012_018600 [Brassica carinata]
MAHCHFVGSPLVAEGLILREALTFCISSGVRRIHVLLDSVQLINALTKATSFTELHGITADISSLALNFEFISFDWIHRSKNKEADALAKQALFGESAVVLNIGA